MEKKPIHSIDVSGPMTDDIYMNLIDKGLKEARKKVDKIQELFGEHVELHITYQQYNGVVDFFVGVKFPLF